MELTNKIPNLDKNRSLPPSPIPKLPRVIKFSRFWKLFVFDVLAVLSAAAVGYGCLLYFSASANFIIFALVAAFFLMMSFFAFLFAKQRTHLNVVVFLQMLAFLGFFYAVRIPVILSAFAVLVVFYFLAQHGASSISENSLKFRLGSIAKIYMKRLFVGFALAAIILYLPQWDSGNVFIPQPQFQKWYDGLASLSQRFYVGVDLTASAGSFAESVIRTQLATNKQFKELPGSAQDEVIRKGVQELMVSMSKSLGFTLTPETPLAESFYRYLVNLFTGFKNQFGDSFLAAWAVALFVIVWSIGTLLIWAVVVATYIFFEFLSIFGIVYVAGESRTKEIVELS